MTHANLSNQIKQSATLVADATTGTGTDFSAVLAVSPILLANAGQSAEDIDKLIALAGDVADSLDFVDFDTEETAVIYAALDNIATEDAEVATRSKLDAYWEGSISGCIARDMAAGNYRTIHAG